MNRMIERSRRVRRAIVDAVKNQACKDCRRRWPSEVMEFDHARGKKKFNIGGGRDAVNIRELLIELAKCDVVCANCHRIRTERRRVCHKC